MDGERTCRFSCTLVACTEARVGVIEVPIADGGYPDRELNPYPDGTTV